jgi:hypothetical protein
MRGGGRSGVGEEAEGALRKQGWNSGQAWHLLALLWT